MKFVPFCRISKCSHKISPVYGGAFAKNPSRPKAIISRPRIFENASIFTHSNENSCFAQLSQQTTCSSLHRRGSVTKYFKRKTKKSVKSNERVKIQIGQSDDRFYLSFIVHISNESLHTFIWMLISFSFSFLDKNSNNCRTVYFYGFCPADDDLCSSAHLLTKHTHFERKKIHNLGDVRDGKIDIQKPISDLTLIIQVKRSIFRTLSSVSPADCSTVIVSVFHRFIIASNENVAGKTGKYLNRRGTALFRHYLLSLCSLCTFVLFVIYLLFWLMLHQLHVLWVFEHAHTNTP